MADRLYGRHAHDSGNRRLRRGRRNVHWRIDGDSRTATWASGTTRTYTPSTVSMTLRKDAKTGRWRVLPRKTYLLGYGKGGRICKEYLYLNLAPPPDWLAGLIADEEARP